MSDFQSSLPIRTENNGDVVVRLVDGTIPSQALTVNPDGSVNVVGTVAVTATDLDIRDLSFAADKVDASGSVVALDSATLAALENVTVSATDLDIRDLAFATDKVDVSGSEVSLAASTLAALENITVSATDLDIRNLAAATDSVSAHLKDAAGSAFSSANPLPVVISSSQPGTEINSFHVATLGAGASSEHEYVVSAGQTLLLSQIECSASGKMKIEVQVETAVSSNVFQTKFVQFNSTANPNMSLHLTQKISVAAGVRVKVIKTNKDQQSQDVYSTISGTES